MGKKSKQEIRDLAAKNIALTMKRMVSTTRLLLEDQLEAYGMSMAQFRMLAALHEEPEISSAELARNCFITPQSMQTLVVRAEREGWIKRAPSPTNRRILTAKLTPKGQTVFEEAKQLWANLSREMWEGAKLSEMEDLNRILDTAVNRLQPRLDKLHQRRRHTADTA